jgi:hypothetical protein
MLQISSEPPIRSQQGHASFASGYSLMTPTAVRITIGTPQQNEKFLAAFDKVIAHTSVTKRRRGLLTAQ